MKRFWIVMTVAMSIGLSMIPQSEAQNAADLVYLTEEYKPFNYSEDDEIKGISVELLRLMWAKAGVPEQDIKVFPWARGYKLVQNESNHVLFSMTRTEAREELFKWVGPIHTAKFILVARKERNITLETLDDAKAYAIGTIREDVTEQLLLEAGFDKSKLHSVSKLTQNVQKLESGRVDLVVYTEKGFYDFLRSENYNPQDFETVWVIKESSSYYAFHKDTPDAVIQTLQTALDTLQSEREEILTKYLNE